MKQACPSVLLFVGFRQGAWEAAQRLGLAVAIIHDRPQKKHNSKKMVFIERLDFSDHSESLCLFIQKKYGHHKIAAVVALTEKAVVLAAYLRKAWNLPGVLPGVALLCHDKWEMKNKALSSGISITPFQLIATETKSQSLSKELGLPVVLKERNLSGSRSLKICRDLTSLQKNIKKGLLAEKFVYGQEISIESFIQDNKVVFRNLTHYYSPLAINILPAQVSKEILQQVEEINNKVIEDFGIERGITHMEVYLTQEGPVFGEIALRPPGGYIMELLNLAYGKDAWEILLQLELGQKISYPQTAKTLAASWVLHPGQGIVRSIQGVHEVEQLPEVVGISCKLKPGQKVSTRLGAGEDTGRILFVAENYEQMVNVLDKVKKTLVITMDPPRETES